MLPIPPPPPPPPPKRSYGPGLGKDRLAAFDARRTSSTLLRKISTYLGKQSGNVKVSDRVTLEASLIRDAHYRSLKTKEPESWTIILH